DYLNLKHFGDSFDIVKRSLLQWLSAVGPWAAHPMFTHHVTESDAASFSRFLGVPLASRDVLARGCDRREYLAACRNWRSIFLDPDTAVRLNNREAKWSAEFILGDELVALAEDRAQRLLLTCD